MYQLSSLKEVVVLVSIIPDEWLSMFKHLESTQQSQGLSLWQSYLIWRRTKTLSLEGKVETLAQVGNVFIHRGVTVGGQGGQLPTHLLAE